MDRDSSSSDAPTQVMSRDPEEDAGAITDALTLVAARRRVDDRVMQAEIGAALLADEPARVEIGRFVVIDHLASGGMGSVYRAYDPQLDRRVALKVIAAEAMHAVVSPARLLREATALARLNHPNVVTVYEAGRVGDDVFLAMELVEGVNLAAWVRDAAAFPEVALDCMIQAARGLAAAHRAGVVHRDFKPANVLVGADGRVRVADFGLARTVVRETATFQRPIGADRDRFVVDTGTGLIVGTPRYMAPEQRAGDEVDAAADQFAFCLTAWEVLFKTYPWPEGVPGPQPVASPSNAPPELVDVLRTGLAIDPKDRHASMDEVVRRLEACRSRPEPAFSRKWIAGGLFALALVGAAAWTLRGSGGKSDELPSAERASAPAQQRAPTTTSSVESSPDLEAEVRSQQDAPPPSRPVPDAPASPLEAAPALASVGASTSASAGETSPPASPRERSQPRSPAPGSDERVLGDVRASATRACAAVEGAAEITVEFLVEAEGRPALVRARPSGDARSACVEKRLRAARFRAGPERRATLRVSFDG